LDLPTLDDVRAAHAAALAEATGGSQSWALDSGDFEAQGGGRLNSGASSAIFGGKRRAANSSAGSTSLHDVIVDPASLSPRPMAGNFDGSRFGTMSPPLPGTPTGLANGGETFQPLIDAGSQPGSPSLGGRRPGKLNNIPSSSALIDSPQPSPLLLQSLPGQAGHPSSFAVADGRGSPRPLVRAAAPSHGRTNSIKGAMQAA
jgi:hypothetical protein